MENNTEDSNDNGCKNVDPFTEEQGLANQYYWHPAGIFDDLEDLELNCIFPFILNGTRYDTCALYDVEELGKGSFKNGYGIGNHKDLRIFNNTAEFWRSFCDFFL